MKVTVHVDLTGWFESSTPKLNQRQWDSVSTERLIIDTRPIPLDFPDLSDILAARRFFRDTLSNRRSALIACDQTLIANLPAVEVTFKSPVGKGPAMSYTCELLVRHTSRLIAVSVFGAEFGIAGLRESVILNELMGAATPDQMASMRKRFIPLEWKFERYEPGTRREFAYFLSDDEAQDTRFPWHPLTIVRRRMRWLRHSLDLTIAHDANGNPSSTLIRGEKKGSLFARFTRGLARENDNVHLNLSATRDELLIDRPATPIPSLEFIAQELGEDIANDLRTDPKTPLPARQQEYRNRVLRQQQETGKSNGISTVNPSPAAVTQSPHNQAWPALKDAMEQFLMELPALILQTSVDKEKCWSFKFPPKLGWLGLKMSETNALPVFSSLAMAEHFAIRKNLTVKCVELTALDLWQALPDIRKGMTHFITDPCPDCIQFQVQDPPNLFPLSQFSSEAKILEFLLLKSGFLRARSKFTLESIDADKDPKGRLAALSSFVIHIDPGNPDVNLELVQLGIKQNNNANTFESARRIFRYSPAYLPKLAHLLNVDSEAQSHEAAAPRRAIQAVVMAVIWAESELHDQYSSAVTFYEECITARPDDFLAHQNLGSALWYAGELDRAIDVFSRALLLAQDAAPVLSSRGQTYVEAGEYDKGLADIEKSLQSTGPVSLLQDQARASARAFALNGKGAALNGLGQFDLAQKCFNESVALCPNNAWVYFNMASAFEKQGDFEAAVRNYSISLKMTGPKLNLLKKTAALARLAILDPATFGPKP